MRLGKRTQSATITRAMVPDGQTLMLEVACTDRGVIDATARLAERRRPRVTAVADELWATSDGVRACLRLDLTALLHAAPSFPCRIDVVVRRDGRTLTLSLDRGATRSVNEPVLGTNVAHRTLGTAIEVEGTDDDGLHLTAIAPTSTDYVLDARFDHDTLVVRGACVPASAPPPARLSMISGRSKVLVPVVGSAARRWSTRIDLADLAAETADTRRIWTVVRPPRAERVLRRPGPVDASSLGYQTLRTTIDGRPFTASLRYTDEGQLTISTRWAGTDTDNDNDHDHDHDHDHDNDSTEGDGGTDGAAGT